MNREQRDVIIVVMSVLTLGMPVFVGILTNNSRMKEIGVLLLMGVCVCGLVGVLVRGYRDLGDD